MTNVKLQLIHTEPFLNNRAILSERIGSAELEIEHVLKKHGVKFAINIVRIKGKAIHQEIVLVDKKD